MPRVAKQKDGPIAKRGNVKKKNGYVMPEAIPLGEILTDLSKKQWKIGPSIGCGGFGEIYTACKADAAKKLEDYDCVVKIEPHGNGPLFVEMHFYMRNAKLEDIKAYCKKNSLKSLGMPHLIGTGSHELKGVKHRFIVMPRFGKDVWSFFLANNKILPEHTVYRLAIQMLDVYEYIHDCTYVHGDLKGANILLGLGKGGASQAYLVDFGLASHYTTKEFKPDPKKMHNGTIEYTSRDAHNGVPTMRGDFEILGYNIIHWLGATLPWEKENLLNIPIKVQKSKEEFMSNIDAELNTLFDKKVSESIKQYMKYVSTLKYDEKPDYEKCRKIFRVGLKKLGKTEAGELDLIYTKTSAPTKTKRKVVEDRSDDDFEEESVKVVPKRMPKVIAQSTPKASVAANRNSPNKNVASPKKSPMKSPPIFSDNKSRTSPRVNITPVVSISKNSVFTGGSSKRMGKTIINDNLTPNPKSSKTYEFNFELDVSLDANVIVNVNRRKRARGDDKSSDPETPNPRVRIRKLSTTPQRESATKTSKNGK